MTAKWEHTKKRGDTIITLDFRGSKPIYEQIMEQYKRNVMKGYFKAGDAIPSVRKLALELGVTPGTVAKAYQELERQKIIETVRGKGTFIAGGKQQLNDDRVGQVEKSMSSDVLELKMMGMSKQDVVTMVTRIYEEL